jgi:photosystem II stability/assembly factor-like uncharacterized protein
MVQPVPGIRQHSSIGRRIVHACHFFLVLLGPFVALSAASVEARSWIPVGAPGGNVRDLAQDPRDPNRIYLGTADGILYRSDDGGVRWQRLNPGFPLRGYSLDNIVVDPGGVVYVGYWEVHGPGGGVARSADRGQTFEVLEGIKGESVRALALAPSDQQVISAGTLTGVFLSRDRGRTWVRATPKGHAGLRNIESLAFDPRDPQVIYAGTWHLVWKTRDGGGAWEPAHRGMIDDSDVMTLTVDQVRPQTIYATACTGIYRSTGAADEWTKLRGIPFSSRRTRAFAQGADDLNLLLAGTTEGLWVSENAGDSWKQVTPKELVVNAVLAQPGGTILLGTEEAGVLRSADQGRTWASSNTGFSERFVFKLLFDETGRRLIVAVWGAPRYGGVFVARSVGGPWSRLGQGLDGHQVLSLALLRNAILAGTDDGIFVRPSGAKAWTRLPTRLDGREVNPRVTELLVPFSNCILAATPKGVMRSLDAGQTWAQPVLSRAGEVFDLAASRDDPDVVVAATKSGFYRSQDGGETWKQVSSALGVTWNALAFAPSDDRVIYATTSGGLLRSGDQGVTWRRVQGGLPHSDLTGIAFNPDGRTIYVSDFTWGGIFRSVDGGSNWSRLPTDGLGSDRVWTLSVDPDEPDRVLAAPSAGGLHMMVASPASSRRAKASN